MDEKPATPAADPAIEPEVVIRRPHRKSDELKIAVYDAMLAILKLIARIASDKNGG